MSGMEQIKQNLLEIFNLFNFCNKKEKIWNDDII